MTRYVPTFRKYLLSPSLGYSQKTSVYSEGRDIMYLRYAGIYLSNYMTSQYSTADYVIFLRQNVHGNRKPPTSVLRRNKLHSK
jgi:hypothetical protein